MTTRSYGQYCGIAKALDVIGDRWTLLVLRELMTGPRRYSDLQAALPAIATNVLSSRLRQLEGAGIVERRARPVPSRFVEYAVTPSGRELESVLLALGRWGARRLGVRAAGELRTAGSTVMTLRSAFRRGTAHGLSLTYELRIDTLVVHLRILDGVLEAGEGSAPNTDLVIHSHMDIETLVTRGVSAAEAVSSGQVVLEGPYELFQRFVEIFRI